MTAMVELGICIVTRSSRDVISSCLESLIKQTSRLDLEIVVADNDSDDSTKVAAISVNKTDRE